MSRTSDAATPAHEREDTQATVNNPAAIEAPIEQETYTEETAATVNAPAARPLEGEAGELLDRLFHYFHDNRQELARALGVHRSSVDRWFAGKSRPNGSTLMRMRLLAQERGVE